MDDKKIDFNQILNSVNNDIYRACDLIKKNKVLDFSNGPKHAGILLSNKKENNDNIEFITLEKDIENYFIGRWCKPKNDATSVFKRKEAWIIHEDRLDRVLQTYFDKIAS